jgi:hemerythrin-like domain-containing protein
VEVEGGGEMEDVLKEILNEIKSLRSDVNSLHEGQEQLKKKVDDISQQIIVGVAPYFEKLEEHVDHRTTEVSSRVKHLSDVQEEQHRIIEKLSYRSLQHETEISDLKRILNNQ